MVLNHLFCVAKESSVIKDKIPLFLETDLREWGVTDFLPVTTLPWEVQRIRGNENEAGIKCRCLGNHDSFNYHPNALVPQLCYGTTTQGDSCKVKKKKKFICM